MRKFEARSILNIWRRTNCSSILNSGPLERFDPSEESFSIGVPSISCRISLVHRSRHRMPLINPQGHAAVSRCAASSKESSSGWYSDYC